MTGTLVVGTGCADTTVEDCDLWRQECWEACAPGDELCQLECEEDYEECLDVAYLDEQRRADQADAAAEAAVACVAVLACTVEALGDGDGDGDGDWSEPAPTPEGDDWGEDWGELEPADALELGPRPDLGG